MNFSLTGIGGLLVAGGAGNDKSSYCNKYRFHTDPSGTFVRYDAKAIGSGSEAAQSELQDKWHKVRVIS